MFDNLSMQYGINNKIKEIGKKKRGILIFDIPSNANNFIILRGGAAPFQQQTPTQATPHSFLENVYDNFGTEIFSIEF